MKEEKASRLSVTLGLGEMDKLHITVKRKVFSRFSSFLLLISYFFFYGSISGFSWWVSKIFFVSFFLEIPVAGYDFLR
jgi:hypothetical protein